MVGDKEGRVVCTMRERLQRGAGVMFSSHRHSNYHCSRRCDGEGGPNVMVIGGALMQWEREGEEGRFVKILLFFLISQTSLTCL